MIARLTRNGVVAMLWPVATDAFTLKPVAYFFDYGDAADYAHQHEGYIGEPRYDHLPRPQILERIEEKALGDGSYRIAA